MRGRASAVLLASMLAIATVACQTRPPLTFSPESLPNTMLGVPYSAVITISGNQTPVGNVSVDPGPPGGRQPLPPGLTLQWNADGDRSRAELSGTPVVAGTYEFAISAWCLGTNVSGQTGSHQYRIVVFGPDAPGPT